MILISKNRQRKTVRPSTGSGRTVFRYSAPDFPFVVSLSNHERKIGLTIRANQEDD